MIFITAIIFTGIVFTGCEYSLSFSNTTRYSMADTKELKIEKTKVEDLKRINIDSRIGDIEFIKSEDFYVEIDYWYFLDKPEFSTDDGILEFDDYRSFPQSYNLDFSLKNTIKIYLPGKADLERIDIKAASGDISLSDFLADQLKVSVAYGDLELINAEVRDADISMASGSSEISDFNMESLAYTNSYGEADFKNINVKATDHNPDPAKSSLKISMASGDGTFDTVTGKTLDISNSYGNISCKGMVMEQLDADLSSGNLKVTGSSVGNLDLSNSYGDVILQLKGHAGDYELDLGTSYGSIEVEGKSYDGHLRRESGGANSISADLSSGDIELEFE